MLLRSLDRGETWEELSPDLTTNDPVKIAGKGHIMFCTITTISESPIKPGVIWVGTDDGRVHLTRNHGAGWEEMTQALAAVGAPNNTWVGRVAASNHGPGTAYVVKSGYREDVFKPFVYRTRDFGKTWEDIGAGLPDAPTSVLWEDLVNPDLLFVGTDIGVYATIDGGESWIPLKNNMPTVPVRDLLVHPREKDLVVGSYGRGVWVTNVSPLQELRQEVLDTDFHLFDIVSKPIDYSSQRARWGNYHMTGDNHLRTPNERPGMPIFYYIKEKRQESLTLTILDCDGNAVAKLKTKTEPGIHKLVWNARRAGPGTYRVVLSDGTTEIAKKGILKPRLLWPLGNPDHLRK
jgi:hypothetical protein